MKSSGLALILLLSSLAANSLSGQILPATKPASSTGEMGSDKLTSRPRAKREVPTLQVVAINYSGASPGLIARAEQQANQIFDQSGIRLAWINCPPVPSEISASFCHGGLIQVRVLPRHFNDYFRDSVFGFAVQPILASVYYDSALTLAQTAANESETSTILGCLIAHEIGHLLLGPNSHTASGIMQARWDDRQIEGAMKGLLTFTREQSRRLQADAQLRTARLSASVSPEF